MIQNCTENHEKTVDKKDEKEGIKPKLSILFSECHKCGRIKR